MEKGLGKFCRDVDKLTKDLWRADHFKVEVPRKGDTLILVKGTQVVKIEVLDIVASTVESTAVVSAKITASPPFTGKNSLVGQILSGAYSDGESVWTDKKNQQYTDYRLLIKGMAKDKPLYRLTGRLRKVVKSNNGSLNIALTSPSEPSLFQQCCTLQDVLFWSKKKRHYLSVFTTLVNATISAAALIHNQPAPALLTAICSLICFGCLHLELQRQKKARNTFGEQKAKLDKEYLELKAQVNMGPLNNAQMHTLTVILYRYHVLIIEHIHPHFGGLATSWAGQLHNAVTTMTTADLFYYLDQYVEALYLPD